MVAICGLVNTAPMVLRRNPFADIRISACIFAGDFALIARFVQQRQLVGCIACDKDMCNAGLHW